MKVKEITDHLESTAPLSLQESYDNSGLIIGSPESEVTRVLVCLDSTPEVIAEAVEKKCEMVIAHHPIVFRGLKKINGSNYVERTVISAIKNDIALYAIHTNLDNILDGVNSKIAEKIGIVNAKKILSLKNYVNTTVGAGMVGNLGSSMDEIDFLKMLKSNMKVGCIKHTKLLGKKIGRVAVCGGAGSFLLEDAISGGADIFVTSDFTYHQFFDAEEKILIADIGHYESEQFTYEVIRDILETGTHPSSSPLNIEVLETSIKTNPVHYF